MTISTVNIAKARIKRSTDLLMYSLTDDNCLMSRFRSSSAILNQTSFTCHAENPNYPAVLSIGMRIFGKHPIVTEKHPIVENPSMTD